MRRLALAAAVLAAAPAFAQGPPPPPPPPPPADPVWAATEGPAYIRYQCERGAVLFRADAGPTETQEVWLDDEPAVHRLPYREADGVYTDGTYTASRGEAPTVRRDGAVVRTGCAEGRGRPAARAEGRRGVTVAWARMNPKPLTTYLLSEDGQSAVWVGGDLLTLDGTTVDAVAVRPDLAPGRSLVDVRLTPEAAAALEAITTRHLHQPLAFLSDGVLLLAPHVQETIRGGRFTLTVPEGEADRLAAVIRSSP